MQSLRQIIQVVQVGDLPAGSAIPPAELQTSAIAQSRGRETFSDSLARFSCCNKVFACDRYVQHRTISGIPDKLTEMCCSQMSR